MRKIFILTKREYRTSVRTKGFIIGLIIAPILMGGGLLAVAIFQDKVDVSDKSIMILDHSGVIAEPLIEIAEERNKTGIFDEESGEKIRPAYHFEIIEADKEDPFQQKLELSNRIRNKELHAFIEIGPDIIHPGDDPDKSRIRYYSENSFVDNVRDWVSWPINNRIRQLRVEELNVDEDAVKDLFYYVSVEGLGLISFDVKTGDVKDAKESNVVETILIPYVMMLLMFMMVLMAAIPLLSAVMEEKGERIAEVLLSTVTPFQFMMSKILGGISISLTGSAVYVIGGIIITTQMNFQEYIPYHVLPWFFAFMILNIIMIGSIMAALGSACNDSKDAQSLQFPAMLPVILPMFLMLPVLQEPLSTFSTWLSLFPPFTPMLMIVRQATPVVIPAWQPIVGLIGVSLFTLLSVWAGGRVFRTCILLQGKRPKFSTLVRYIIKG